MRSCVLTRIQLYLYVLLYLTSLGKTSAKLASQPCILTEGSGTGLQLIEQDCVLSAAAPGSTLKGRLGHLGGPPALVFGGNSSTGQAAPITASQSSVQLEYVVLAGYQLPDPNSPAGLVPEGLVAGGSGFVVLRDVRILVDSATLQQHVQYFNKIPGVHRKYTDNSSFLHVNWHASSSASWQSVGLLLATSLQDARDTNNPSSNNSTNPLSAAANGSDRQGPPAAGPAARKYSYVLAASNSTLVQHMSDLGAVQGPAAMLAYVDTNVTLSKPPVPATGVVISRPCVLVGLATANTSLDLHMTVNSIIMSAPFANLTVDSLVIENMAPGDSRSAEIARPLSVSSANNFWALYYDRNVNKLLIKNCTVVLGSQTELDYYLYWATVYHSSLPYFREMAKFVREVIRMSTWELTGASNNSVMVVNSEAGSCTVQDTLYTINHVVAPVLPSPALDPRLQLQQSQKSPLVTAVTTSEAFREQLEPLSPSEQGRTHVVLLLTNISVLPSSSNSSSSATAQQGNASAPPGGVPVPGPLTLLGDFSNQQMSWLSLDWRRDLLALPDDAPAGHLQVQHLVLKGLAQGPAAAAASTLDSPDVWAIMLWSIRRKTASSVSLAACMLELPLQELEQIRQLAEEGTGQVVLKLSGDTTAAAGDGLLVLSDVRPSSSSSLHVGSLTGQGLNGTNLTLVSAPSASDMPGGYYWPNVGIRSVSQGGQLSSSALAAAVAVPVAVAVVTAAAVVALLISRRRKQRQQRDIEKAQAGLVDDQLLPDQQYRCSSETNCTSFKPSSQGGTQPSSIKDSSYDTARPQDQQQLQQQGLEILRAWPHGALCIQGASHASTPQQSPVISAAWLEQRPSASGDTGSGSSSTPTCSPPFPSDLSNWQRARQAAESVGCCIPEMPQDPEVAAAGGSGSEVQQPNPQQHPQQQTGFVDSQTLFHSAATVGIPAALAADSMQRTAEQQHEGQQQQGRERHVVTETADRGLSPAGASAGQQPYNDRARAATAAEQQQQQQQLLPQRTTSSQESEPRAKASSLGSKSVGAGSGGGASAAASAPKPWQRVSTAIGLLQHGITVRRLEAGLADSRAPSLGSATAATPVACCDSAAACGGSCHLGTADKQQQQDTMQRANSSVQQVQLLDMIGRGTFASVYRAIWRGRCVAVKVVHLPGDAACVDGDADVGGSLAAALQTRERMAVMEAVISVTMSHPNIVQVFTFALKPLPTALVGSPIAAVNDQQQLKQQLVPSQADGKPSGWELQLVMEFCEEGSLRQALNQGRLTDPHSTTGLPALHMVLALAHDVACAMLHLHSEGLIHADLKASNVLLTKGIAHIALTSSASNILRQLPASIADAAAAYAMGVGPDAAVVVSSYSSTSSRLPCAMLLELAQAKCGGRLIAKVADFGLSLSLNPGDTHVSHMHAGTLTHMAPELLLHGRASAASDVYAFGILLWELLTGRRAFLGVPVALLGHNVVHLRWRPGWPQGIPAALKLLVEQCWAQEAAVRPSFQDILVRLEQLMQLSPEQLYNPGCLVEQHQVQQQQQQQPDTAQSQQVGQQRAQQQIHPQQQQQQGEMVNPSAAACADAGAGAGVAVHDLTGAWSLPGGNKPVLG